MTRAYGFGAAVDSICSLLERQRPRAEIAAAVPDDLVDAVNLIGSSQRLRRRLKLKRLSDSRVDRVIGIVSDTDTLNSFARSAL